MGKQQTDGGVDVCWGIAGNTHSTVVCFHPHSIGWTGNMEGHGPNSPGMRRGRWGRNCN